MKILLTGKNGQVGWELNRSLLPLGEVIAVGRKEADFSKPEALRKLVHEIKPDVIVNAAAYTAVDKAESEEELATLINGVAAGVLAEEAKHVGALLIHYSTDYVFDGTKDSPYVEDDIPNPINAYGRSKLAGEQAIQSVGADYLILRTSWVYAARGHNFLCTIMRLAQENSEIKIISDQVGIPTWSRLIAETTAFCMRQFIEERHQRTFNSGIYNLTSSGIASWYDFATKIINNACLLSLTELKVKNIQQIDSVDYPTPAKRPRNSVLSTDKLTSHFKLTMPNWEKTLNLCMDGMQ